MAGTAWTARKAAATLIAGVLAAGRDVSAQIEQGALAGLEGPDRARAQRLALETLRRISKAEAVLNPLLRKSPPERIHAILLLATVEILELGAPPHGVVGAAVDITRMTEKKMQSLSGLVNAVLRKVAADGPAQWPLLPRQQMPPWLRQPLIAAYGAEAIAAIEAAHEAGAPIDLTPRDGDAAALAALTGGAALPTGSVRMAQGAQISELPGYAEGSFWVQDAAAALAARALHVQPGERVADLCAAPGGKTMQLAAAGAQVTAVEISTGRAQRITENLARTRLTAEVVVADALTFDAPPFDAVLLDAPCTATGTIRRHPELPFLRGASDIATLTALQDRLFDRAVALTRPGGRLVFATCSLLPAEGEDIAARALARHPEISADPAALALPGVDPAWLSIAGLRLRPDYLADLGGMDGFLVAAFRKADG